MKVGHPERPSECKTLLRYLEKLGQLPFQDSFNCIFRLFVPLSDTLATF